MWESLDSWIAATGAVAASACALPGCFLLLRRQSLTGDAISHAALPGIVLAFLAAQMARQAGWLSDAGYEASRQLFLLAGAVVLGVGCAVGSEWVQRRGGVEPSAALGVVFITLFAVGLVLLRLIADQVDLDPDCVLYGTLENSVLDTVPLGSLVVPRALLRHLALFLLNLVLIGLFFKELRIASFDPGLANAMGIPAWLMHYLLMTMTAFTAVSVFESVGSILVIAMLIVPAATAYLLTDRLVVMLVLAALLAAASAWLGHAAALFVPRLVFPWLGYPQVTDASTSGMMAVVAGALLVAALLAGPRYGWVAQFLRRRRLATRIATEDLLAWLYRNAERGQALLPLESGRISQVTGMSRTRVRRAVGQLVRRRWIERTPDGLRLTAAGHTAAVNLVRAHRLWESFLAERLDVPAARLHESAERIEHYLDSQMLDELEAELQLPERDPHGSLIPRQARDE
ncbi:MAG: manganese ABC transporter permease [Pirellulaceae bacterium]|nr:MAG: manganese ABC transporter permease [Pirellulaceae bacterium]